MKANGDYCISWPKEIEIRVLINWRKPETLDVISSDMVEENETAYFYAIVAKHRLEWLTHYIGMVYRQTIDERHKSFDHKNRMKGLRKKYPNKTFHLTLGTPKFIEGKLSETNIRCIEHLLIYSNYSDKMINVKKVNFPKNFNKQIYVKNTGFIEHVWEESVYGVFNLE